MDNTNESLPPISPSTLSMSASDSINITSLTVSSLKNATSKPPSSPLGTPPASLPPRLTNPPLDPVSLSTGVLNTLSVSNPHTTCPLPSPISSHDSWRDDHIPDKKSTSNEPPNSAPKHVKNLSASSSFHPRPSSSSQIAPVHIPAPFQAKTTQESTPLETNDKRLSQQQKDIISIFDSHPEPQVTLTIPTSRASTPLLPTPEPERVHDEQNIIAVGTTINTLNSFHTAQDNQDSDTALDESNLPLVQSTTTISTQVISHSSSIPSLQATRSTITTTYHTHSKTGSNPLLKNHLSSPSQSLSLLSNNMSSTPSTSSPMSTPNLSQGAIFSNSTAASSAEPLQTSGNNISSNMGASSSTTMTNSGSASSSTTMTSTTSPMATGGMSSGVSDAKLKRFLEHNQRLREQLEMRRISVSEAGQCLIKYVTNTKDSLLPMLWGNPTSDPFSKQTKACCTIS